MDLREFFSEDVINLELQGETKDSILKELITLLALNEKSDGILYKMLKRRENLGSTGIGRGRRLGERGADIPAVGSRAQTPSRTRYRKSERSAASFRPRVDGCERP